MQNIKHIHGTPNEIIQTEEETMLALIDRAIASKSNSQTIGRSGEIPLMSFLDRHLPNTLSVKSGNFVTPNGDLSPQIDILVLDSRYPLLSENSDGSVLAMLHSVISCIEIKTNIKNKDLQGVWKNSKAVRLLANEVFNDPRGFGGVDYMCFSYRCGQRLDSFSDKYFEIFSDIEGYTDLYLLRLPEKDLIESKRSGALFHMEPVIKDEEAPEEIEYLPMLIPEHTPLSDFYYSLVQNSYYNLDYRNFGVGEIGKHFMDYMSWSTVR